MNMDTIIKELTKIQSWPDVFLIFVLVIIMGYLLKAWESFPNKFIPHMVILMGGVLMLLLSDSAPKEMNPRVWHVKNCIVGFVIGAIAWGVHNQAISRLEDYVSGFLGGRKQTEDKPKDTNNQIEKP